MISVLFFASLRERLGVGSLNLTVDEAGSSVSALRTQLAAKDERWAAALASRLVVAVNQNVVTGDQVLNDGDEVAFFPPVTGG